MPAFTVIAKVRVMLDTVPVAGETISPFEVFTTVPTVPVEVAAVRASETAPAAWKRAASTGAAKFTVMVVILDRCGDPLLTVKPLTAGAADEEAVIADENSDVLPEGSVAVAVMNSPAVLAPLRATLLNAA